jgi:hypothetical protein
MLTLTCDIEGCKSSIKMDDQALPFGWAIIQWTAETKGERGAINTAALAMYRGIKKSERIPSDVLDPVINIIASEDIPPIPVPFKARICPSCLSEKLEFGHIERGY